MSQKSRAIEIIEARITQRELLAKESRWKSQANFVTQELKDLSEIMRNNIPDEYPELLPQLTAAKGDIQFFKNQLFVSDTDLTAAKEEIERLKKELAEVKAENETLHEIYTEASNSLNILTVAYNRACKVASADAALKILHIAFEEAEPLK